MGKCSIKSLEKTPDYQGFIQNRRPVQQAQDEALRAKVAVNEVKTYQHITTPNSRRTQKILTPAQQIMMRKNIAATASVEDALVVVDLFSWVIRRTVKLMVLM